MPTFFVISGPNGCGKSTLTQNTTLFDGVEIINPDEIARGMVADGTAPAAREALHRRQAALDERRTHLVETTLAGSGTLRHMTAARQAGYRVVLHHISVATPSQALDRIRGRVAFGGHDVPEVDVRRWFARSHANLPDAIACADKVHLHDNSDPDRPHREVAILQDGTWLIDAAVPDWALKALAIIGEA